MKITFYENACAVIEADDKDANIEVSENGNEATPSGNWKIAICRCGKSKLGNLCDGSHKNDPKE